MIAECILIPSAHARSYHVGLGFPEYSSGLLMGVIIERVANKGDSRRDSIANYLAGLFSLISLKLGRIMNEDLAVISKQKGWVIR
ncbi:MAG: hypothetical protein LUQ38_04735 [Methanotrichaceae archaeon]|nr:hypothetical protein [Methanotrichaceae archaeon]MDD1758137.1 hypothetical protein [Methanotrichaceae archaeon]